MYLPGRKCYQPLTYFNKVPKLFHSVQESNVYGKNPVQTKRRSCGKIKKDRKQCFRPFQILTPII